MHIVRIKYSFSCEQFFVYSFQKILLIIERFFFSNNRAIIDSRIDQCSVFIRSSRGGGRVPTHRANWRKFIETHESLHHDERRTLRTLIIKIRKKKPL